MIDQFSTESLNIVGYSPIYISPEVSYKSPTIRVEAEMFPVEEVIVQTLQTFSHREYETTKEIDIVVRITEENVIIRCLPVRIFTYSDSYYGAIENFKSLLIDYYEDLRKREKTLAKNLLEELKYLKGVISATKTVGK